MMPIDFECPYCKKQLSTEESAAGKQAACPECGKPLVVPGAAPAAPAGEPAGPVIFCAKCGQKNPDNNYKCSKCGAVLHFAPAPRYAAQDDGTMGGLIPYKNQKALWAYYLGIFSLIPCLAIPLGITGFAMGLQGLDHAKAHPEAKGQGHAWTGIILGGGCALVNLIILGAMMKSVWKH